ncbi:conserved hypothetical protein [Leishmania major strain Friedlin]|uniref:Uncharacterized protein n=1 Tax=Leishmania major TaxID=5664 RepID=Q4QB13_LEIMA|nr:conserved hypothetical protein [Leishmania major strain Friedlin]CAG9574396.1 hypothetical_protein_-_conserved [Leishmania major strain Friedlin]CAJ04916.1 conserved hypothetical protein [Leishmania major strain Friedlin]|eukprot:XP_001683485.1 conserved hypothetical protein [Leishmania major strain Friedlin]
MLSSASSAFALWSACGIVALVCAFSTALLCVTVRQLCGRVNAMQHGAVAIALIPVSVFLGHVLCASYNALGETLQTFAKENVQGLPQPLVYVIVAIRPLVAQVGLTDAMWMACLLFTAYSVAKVWHHLIDITRLLKASRRRLQLPDMRERRRQEEAANTKLQKRR